jgi:CheY-like chemotaxis protein
LPRRILVVDDNVDASDSLAMLLTFAGHEVHAVYGANPLLAQLVMEAGHPARGAVWPPSELPLEESGGRGLMASRSTSDRLCVDRNIVLSPHFTG